VVWVRAYRVAGVRQPRLVGSLTVQPRDVPVKGAGFGSPVRSVADGAFGVA
jgi:hypothetical protein